MAKKTNSAAEIAQSKANNADDIVDVENQDNTTSSEITTEDEAKQRESALKSAKTHISNHQKLAWIEILSTAKFFDFQIYTKLIKKGDSPQIRKWLVSYFKTNAN